MVKQTIKEAMEKNPIGLKEAVEAELRTRVALALEAKMGEMSGLEESIYRAGDRVTWRDSSSGKNMTGTVHSSAGGRMKGGSLTVVKVDGTHMGSTTKVPHKQLSKLEESVKDLGGGIRVNVNSDKSMVIGDRSAPGGPQMVVLEKGQVAKMVSVLTAGKAAKTDLGGGAKLSLDKDGDVVISANTPGGREMVVLTAKQVQEILKLAK